MKSYTRAMPTTRWFVQRAFPTLFILVSACALDSGKMDAPFVAGEACVPEQIPPGGFDRNEAYVESQSTQCQGNACLAFRLRGDPTLFCEDTAVPECASRVEVEARVYCTCRCATSSDAGVCTCPEGFSCFPVLELGGSGVEGSYCVKNGTF